MFASPEVVAQHTRDKHKMPQLSSEGTHFSFKCDICSKIFSSPDIFAQHSYDKHGVSKLSHFHAPQATSMKPLLPPEIIAHDYELATNHSFQCSVCVKAFGSPEILAQHFKDKHNANALTETLSGGSSLSCSICSKVLVD